MSDYKTSIDEGCMHAGIGHPSIGLVSRQYISSWLDIGCEEAIWTLEACDNMLHYLVSAVDLLATL